MNKLKRFESSGHCTQAYSIGFDLNSSGNLLASGSANGCVFIYDIQSTKLNRKIEVFNKELNAQPCMDVKFKYDSVRRRELVAASGANGTVKVFEI